MIDRKHAIGCLRTAIDLAGDGGIQPFTDEEYKGMSSIIDELFEEEKMIDFTKREHEKIPDSLKRLDKINDEDKRFCQILHIDGEPDNYAHYSDKWRMIRFKDGSILHIEKKDKENNNNGCELHPPKGGCFLIH